MVRGSWEIFTQSKTVGSFLDNDFSETSLRHKFVTISSRREGGIDSCDLSLFQLSLLGQEGGGKLKCAQCYYFCRFFLMRPLGTMLTSAKIQSDV